MTKKDYVAIAEVISGWTISGPAEREQSRAIAEKLAVVFKRDNPRFDRARFLAACGISE